MTIRTGLFGTLLLGFSAISPGSTVAQSSTAAVTGVVQDSLARPLAGVEIVATNERTGFSYSGLSDEDGRYLLRGLAPGTYDMAAKRLGLASAPRARVVLPVGSTKTLHLTLSTRPEEIAGITVVGSAPLMETTQSDFSHSLSPEDIASIPLESRDFVGLAAVAPGATAAPPDPAAVASTSVGALGAFSLGIQVDGGNFTIAALNEQPGNIPLLAIQEFEVLTSTYAAEFGQAASGVVNAVTRTGGNRLSVEAFALYRNRALNARGVGEAEKPQYNRVHLGAAVGLPIVRDRTHLFVAVESKIENNFATVETGGVFPSLEGTFKTPLRQQLLFARIDHRPSDRDEWMLRVTGDVSTRRTDVGASDECSLLGGQVGAQEFGSDFKQRMVSALGSYRRRTGVTGLSESRIQVMRFVPERQSMSEAPALVHPSVCSGGNTNPFKGGNWRVELGQDVSWVARGWGGSHHLKAGLSASWVKVEGRLGGLTNGAFNFASDVDPLPRLYIKHLEADETERENWQLGAFLQDEWRASADLTLQLGLRYDIETGIAARGISPEVVGGLPFLSGEPRPVDANNISPRLGIAWTPGGDINTVVRGGFGLFFNQYLLWPAANESLAGLRAFVRNPGTTDPDLVVIDTSAVMPAAYPGGNERSAPVSRQVTLGIERVLPWQAVLRIDGLWVQAWNQPLARELQRFGPPRYPQHSIVWQVLNRGEATGKQVTIGLRKRFDGGRFNVHYTLASRETTTDRWADFSAQNDPDVEIFDGEFGPAAWDERHRVVALAEALFPVGVVGSMKAVYSSARPYTALLDFPANDINLDGKPNDRPSGESRNARRGPDYFVVDLGLRRAIQIGASQVSIVANVYNLLNRSNLLPNSVVGVVSSPQFGQALGAHAKRQVEVGLFVRH
jgi:Carboxypeptidase regulatory-like domain/TonB dependent receptor-like, beta-barrel